MPTKHNIKIATSNNLFIFFSYSKKIKIIEPIFFSTPTLEVGIPACLAILCLVDEMPNALFQEKEKPNLHIQLF